MKPLSFAFAWALFAVSYIIFYILISDYFPNEWLLEISTKYYPQLIENYVWDHVIASTTLVLALMINSGFILLAFIVTNMLRRTKHSTEEPANQADPERIT